MKKELSKNSELVSEIKVLIEQSKQQVSVAINATIAMVYWQAGTRINTEILKQQRAEYGKQIVHTVSTQLTTEYGPGWREKQQSHCLRFAKAINEKEIVYTLCRQLSCCNLIKAILKWQIILPFYLQKKFYWTDYTRPLLWHKIKYFQKNEKKFRINRLVN